MCFSCKQTYSLPLLLAYKIPLPSTDLSIDLTFILPKTFKADYTQTSETWSKWNNFSHWLCNYKSTSWGWKSGTAVKSIPRSLQRTRVLFPAYGRSQTSAAPVLGDLMPPSWPSWTSGMHVAHTHICWLTYTENKNKKIKVQVNFYWLLFVSQYPDKKNSNFISLLFCVPFGQP